MLTIQKMQIKYNITKCDRKIEWVVLHYTANYSKGAGALTHFNYFNAQNRNASADFFVDDNNIIQINDYHSNYTWAVGDGNGKYGITNRNSISIEMCVNSDSDFNKTLVNTIDLVRYLMQELKIPIDRVVRHYDASRKACPLMFCGNTEKDKAWLEFKNKIVNKDYKQILQECTANPQDWIKYVEEHKQNNDLSRYLEQLIEKVYNHGK